MEKSALIAEKKNIELDDVRKESRRRFYKSKEKNGKSIPIETEYPPLKTQDQVQLDNGRKAQTLSSVTQFYQELKKNIYPEIWALKLTFCPGATTHDMYDYLKPLLKKNPDNIILHVGTNNLVNETSRGILNEICSLKNFIEKLCPTCKVIVSNLIYWSNNEKVSLTVKNVNDHLDA